MVSVTVLLARLSVIVPVPVRAVEPPLMVRLLPFRSSTPVTDKGPLPNALGLEAAICNVPPLMVVPPV